jgi:magnesium transporter
VTGVYGMNFANMPELNWQYGFYATMVFIAFICAFLYWRFHKAGWL